MAEKKKKTPEVEETVAAEETAPVEETNLAEETAPVEETAPAAEEAPAKEKAKKKGGKLPLIIVAAVVGVLLVGALVLTVVMGSAATSAYNKKDYEKAYSNSRLALFLASADKDKIAEKYVVEELCKDGRYFEGAEILEKTGLSAEKKAEIYKENSYLGLCTPGQVVNFGKYETDGNAANGGEDMEWIVLTVQEQGGRAFATLLSKNVVGAISGWNRSESSNNTFYAESQLHEWCTVDFYNDFTKTDINLKNKLLIKNVSTADGADGGDSGEGVKAAVYIPSKEEIEQYLVGDLEQYRKAKPTDAAKKAGANAMGSEKTTPYYVRNIGISAGEGAYWAAGFDKDGKFTDGMSMTTTTGLRVCITVDLGKV